MQNPPNHMAIETMCEEDMHCISPHVLSRHMWELDEGMVRPWILQVLLVGPGVAAGLFQVQLLD